MLVIVLPFYFSFSSRKSMQRLTILMAEGGLKIEASEFGEYMLDIQRRLHNLELIFSKINK